MRQTMSNYDNTNKGAFWKNEDRQKDTHPHYKGSINVEGVEYWLSAWKSDGSNPKAPLVKISIQKKESQADKAKEAIREPGSDFEDDDIDW